MSFRIVVTRQIAEKALTRLKSIGELRVWDGHTAIPSPQLAKWIEDADACLTMLTDHWNSDLINHAKNLKVLANMAVGFDNIDINAASRRGILVTNTPDVLTEATAELTWALLLALTRRLLSSHQALMEGQWTDWKPDGFLGTELIGKTLGIVGWGRIGQAVARRSQNFGMRAIALGRASDHASPVERYPLEEFLAQADIISLHVPLTPETRHMVSARWFSLIKPDAYLINTSRGAVIDEKALLDALNHTMAGVALDVFTDEPINGLHPLARHPKVLATPHIGSATRETREAMALRAADNLIAGLAGHRPPHLVNTEAWERRQR